MQKITPFLWYSSEAEEAAAFYASVFPNSGVSRVTALPSESPSGPPGSVKVVEFVLFGQPFIAMSAGPLDPFNHAVTLVVNCEGKAKRASDAMMKMVKIDIAVLQTAFAATTEARERAR